MEKLLEKIAANTEKIARNTDHRSSFYFTLDEASTEIKTYFSPKIELDKNKKFGMAMLRLETYYSFPNIDSKNNTFRYSSDNGRNWKNIYLAEGCYEIGDINDDLQRSMQNNTNITIEANNKTLKTVMKITGNFQVDFRTSNSIRSVLGYHAKVYSAGYHESENPVNIVAINSLRVTNSLINSSYTNGKTDDVIYSFFPNVGPGYKIIEVPKNLIYLPISMDTISSMVTKLTDQNGKLFNLRGEQLSIKFHIKEM